jgi:hypothetical protein
VRREGSLRFDRNYIISIINICNKPSAKDRQLGGLYPWGLIV